MSQKVLARSLEVNLTEHCNLSCYGCDHASPVNGEAYLSVDELAEDLAALSAVYHVFEFRLTGGEPLLHPDLLGVIDAVRRSGVAEKIMLVTNGVLLHKAPDELWKKIDKMWVSIYPGVKRRLPNEEVEALAKRNGVLLRFKVTDEFTTKLLHSENRDPELLKSIYGTCTLRTSCHTLHQGRYFKCSPSPFMTDWLRRVGVAPPDFEGDSVALRDNPNLAQELTDYLRNDTPLTACGYCLGCVGKTIPSRQMNKVAAQQWLAEKDPDVRELIDWNSLTAAQTTLQGVDLTGMLRTLAGERVRWMLTAWLMRRFNINRLGAPPTMIGARLRWLLTAWRSPVRVFLRRLAGSTSSQ